MPSRTAPGRLLRRATTAASTVRLVRWLVVRSILDPSSVEARGGDALVESLQASGHDVDEIDLIAEGFNPCMTGDEHVNYDQIGLDHPDPMVAKHIELVKAADGLAFVFPSGWSVPAPLKGWVERTLLPEVGFVFSPRTNLLGPNLNVAHLAVVTTSEHPRRHRLTFGDPARRVVTRSIRSMCRRRCKTTWLSLYDRSTATPAEEDAFVGAVRTTFAGL